MPRTDTIQRDAAEAAAMPRVLIVEDDRDISQLISRYLMDHGITTCTAVDGSDIDRTIEREQIDLIILDVSLPHEDGFSICARLRRHSNIPIIMLTARAEDIDRILGLELGADDYISKPFNPRELLARIGAVLRRHTRADEPRISKLIFSGWTIELPARRLSNVQGVEVALTSTEFDLLVIFCENTGRVLSRIKLNDLLQKDTKRAGGGDRSIDIVISRLRRKIEINSHNPSLIKTVRSGGYILACPVERSC